MSTAPAVIEYTDTAIVTVDAHGKPTSDPERTKNYVWTLGYTFERHAFGNSTTVTVIGQNAADTNQWHAIRHDDGLPILITADVLMTGYTKQHAAGVANDTALTALRAQARMHARMVAFNTDIQNRANANDDKIESAIRVIETAAQEQDTSNPEVPADDLMTALGEDLLKPYNVHLVKTDEVRVYAASESGAIEQVNANPDAYDPGLYSDWEADDAYEV